MIICFDSSGMPETILLSDFHTEFHTYKYNSVAYLVEGKWVYQSESILQTMLCSKDQNESKFAVAKI